MKASVRTDALWKGAPAAHGIMHRLARNIQKGIYHGGERGKVVRGRPLMFGEETRQVGFKEPLGKVKAIDKRAKQLGMKRSDYLRHLVDEDLKLAGIA